MIEEEEEHTYTPNGAFKNVNAPYSNKTSR